MSAWGAPPASGAWATQVDEEEEENGGELEPVPTPGAFPALGGKTAFPSLGETAAMKETKRDRKKKSVQKMTLGAFVAAGRKEPEVVHLPTAPRTRADGEDEKSGGLGGGFKNYGGDRGGFGDRDRDRDEDRGFGRDEDDGPSRADAADDWGSKKAFVPSGPSRGGGFGDKERGGGFGDRYTDRGSGFGDGAASRADDADKWGSKTFEPSARRVDDRDRQSSFGSRDDDLGPSRADTEDRWSRRAPPPTETSSESRWSGGAPSSSGSRPRLNLKPRSADMPVPVPQPTSAAPSEAGSEDKADKDAPVIVPRTGPKPNPFGQAKPVAVKEVQEPPSRAESRSSQEAEAEPVRLISKPRSNPFGAARPREEVLREKGVQVEKLERLSSRATSVAASEMDAKSEQQLSPLADQPDAEAKAGRSTESPAAEPESKSESKAESLPDVARDAAPELAQQQEDAVDAEKVRSQLENGNLVEPGPRTESVPPSKPTTGTWAKIAAKPVAEDVKENED